MNVAWPCHLPSTSSLHHGRIGRGGSSGAASVGVRDPRAGGEAIIYHAIGFPRGMFPVLFAIPRFIGWLAQWNEMLSDPGYRAYRPRQVYIGPEARPYVPLAQR